MTRTDAPIATTHATTGYMLTVGLAVYGGSFSGGYVTLLTAVFAIFVECISATKLPNLFSSGVAVAVFAWRGMVDFKLGVILGVADLQKHGTMKDAQGALRHASIKTTADVYMQEIRERAGGN